MGVSDSSVIILYYVFMTYVRINTDLTLIGPTVTYTWQCVPLYQMIEPK
jgi:hypothetical protein